jgi:hypothetical protein
MSCNNTLHLKPCGLVVFCSSLRVPQRCVGTGSILLLVRTVFLKSTVFDET